MKKRFFAHKGTKGILIKIALLLVIIYLSLVMTFNILLKSSLKEKLGSDIFMSNLVYKGTNNGGEPINLISPKDIFKYGVNGLLKKEKTDTPLKDAEKVKKHENSLKPLIYIYNTHDLENYDSSLIESYNIKYTVVMASYILSECLEDLGISTFVENESIYEFMNSSGLKYKNSYEASRYYIEKRFKEYPSIKYMIDIHRDSVEKSDTTTVIDNTSYAKVLFVVGENHEKFNANFDVANKFNAKLDERISRGVIKKGGDEVDGIYNQDLSENMLLLEIGGKENTIDEVKNTLKLVAKAIYDTISELN